MSLNIREITSKDDGRWDDFVLNHPQGSVYHLSAWRNVLHSTYGYHPRYLAMESTRSKEFLGIYPSMLVRSRLTGDRLVTLPFTSYCPPLGPEEGLSDMVCRGLKMTPDIKYLELKAIEPIKAPPEFLVPHSSHVTHLLNLAGGESGVYKAFHPTSIRQRIGRAAKNGFRLRIAKDVDDLKSFYRLHIDVRKKHGLPPHPFKFFLNMWEVMSPQKLLFIPLLEHKGEVVAGAVTLRYKDTFTYEYSAAEAAYLPLCCNQSLIWEIIKMGLSEGARWFDFGRSSLDNPTLIEFKERWGAKRQPLSYYYYPTVDKVGTEGSRARSLLNKANRLMPKALLRIEGELLYRHLG